MAFPVSRVTFASIQHTERDRVPRRQRGEGQWTGIICDMRWGGGRVDKYLQGEESPQLAQLCCVCEHNREMVHLRAISFKGGQKHPIHSLPLDEGVGCLAACCYSSILAHPGQQRTKFLPRVSLARGLPGTPAREAPARWHGYRETMVRLAVTTSLR